MSQWAGLPPEKLLQESFMKQLDALQSLDQLAPLTATKEHLPTDIIKILELLGKADNIPFNQLYNLTEDCADRHYTKVIKTLTHLLKNSFHDRQLVLVNSARALKFLESYAVRQAKLWKVLYPHPQLDVVQLNASDYDPDIDIQAKPVIEIQSPNAESIKDDTVPNTTNSEQHTALSTHTNRPQSQPSSVLDDTDHPGYQDNTHARAEYPSDHCPQLEDIPELETDEENWEEG